MAKSKKKGQRKGGSGGKPPDEDPGTAERGPVLSQQATSSQEGRSPSVVAREDEPVEQQAQAQHQNAEAANVSSSTPNQGKTFAQVAATIGSSRPAGVPPTGGPGTGTVPNGAPTYFRDNILKAVADLFETSTTQAASRLAAALRRAMPRYARGRGESWPISKDMWERQLKWKYVSHAGYVAAEPLNFPAKLAMHDQASECAALAEWFDVKEMMAPGWRVASTRPEVLADVCLRLRAQGRSFMVTDDGVRCTRGIGAPAFPEGSLAAQALVADEVTGDKEPAFAARKMRILCGDMDIAMEFALPEEHATELMSFLGLEKGKDYEFDTVRTCGRVRGVKIASHVTVDVERQWIEKIHLVKSPDALGVRDHITAPPDATLFEVLKAGFQRFRTDLANLNQQRYTTLHMCRKKPPEPETQQQSAPAPMQQGEKTSEDAQSSPPGVPPPSDVSSQRRVVAKHLVVKLPERRGSLPGELSQRTSGSQGSPKRGRESPTASASEQSGEDESRQAKSPRTAIRTAAGQRQGGKEVVKPKPKKVTRGVAKAAHSRTR